MAGLKIVPYLGARELGWQHRALGLSLVRQSCSGGDLCLQRNFDGADASIYHFLRQADY